METLAVDRNGPQAFILAYDGKFGQFESQNDQIWALSLDESEASPFYLHTTYQLRAKSMRLFPNIIVNHRRLTKGSDFTRLPRVTSYTPGFLQIDYLLINELQIRFTCFMSDREVLVGDIEIKHTGSEPIALDCELGAILAPMGKGEPTHPERVNSNQVLCGQSDDLFPVLFMSGGPVGTSNPFPALRVPLQLAPGQSSTLHWALASKDSQEASLAAARKAAAPSWHTAASIQIKKHESQTIHITTGEVDWDTAFYLAQMNAMTHLVSPHQESAQRTFIRTRLPDQSMRTQPERDVTGDLSLLDLTHLTQVILPAQVSLFTDLIESQAARVDEKGCLPSQTLRGMDGGSINEAPLLANLCLTLYEIHHDQAFLRRVFPHLQRFFESGWSADPSADPDACPYWDSPAQLQLDTGLFTFDIWEPTGSGLDIRTAQSPALAALLYREASAIRKIAHILGDRSVRNRYVKIARHWQEKLSLLWQEEQQLFSYRDRQCLDCPTRELYYPGRIQPALHIHKRFIQPQRLQVHLTTNDERTRVCTVSITGQNHVGEDVIERFRGIDVRWVMGRAHLTTHNLFSYLESITFEGFCEEDRFLIETANYSQSDISCLLPLWSGGVIKERIPKLIETYANPQAPELAFGIPETWRITHPLPEELPQQVSIQWNTLIIEGMVREGLTEAALGLFSNLMQTILQCLKEYKGFYPFYDIDHGLPKGPSNAITGLAPVRLFLNLAGIKLFSPDQVAIWGSNPFPWPIEVRWQGLWLRREGPQTQIVFPDGTPYQSNATKPLLIESSKGLVENG
jgi:hypothetical protein